MTDKTRQNNNGVRRHKYFKYSDVLYNKESNSDTSSTSSDVSSSSSGDSDVRSSVSFHYREEED